ncbi:uncharacterized protein LOC104697833 [Corvus cornix cornix]|uniref:uncharacterized protein LOC104697833 n=1 Tax=Corvus cornix cornix TaxID=932674 RepID=UPI0019527E25|nr:uncharacterized protein LOC104697833 [Corvus cornix cornix]
MSPPRTSGGSPVTLVLSGGKGRNSPQLSLQDVALGVEDTGREQARSRSSLWGRNVHSSFVDTTDCDHSAGRRTGPPSCGRAPRDGAASGPSNRSFQWAAPLRAAQEQTQLRQREMSRSMRRDYDLRSRLVRHADYDPSSRNRKRQRTSSPCCDQTPRAVPGPSNTSFRQPPMLRAAREQTRPREQRRFPQQGCDGRSQFMQCTDHQPSLSKRKRGRTSPPHCDEVPVDNAVPGPSNTSFRRPPMLRAGRQQTQPRWTEQRRSSQWGYDLRRRKLIFSLNKQTLSEYMERIKTSKRQKMPMRYFEFRTRKTRVAEGNHTVVTEFVFLGLTDKLKLQVLLFTVFLLIYLLTLVGNLGMTVLIQLDSKLHTPMYFFSSSLFFLDICYLSVIIPTILENLMVGTVSISKTRCAMQMFFFLFFGVAECFLLAAMSLDRYFAICYPLHYTIIMNSRVCRSLVAGTYICGTAVGLVHTLITFSSPLCGSAINHFFCEIQPFLDLLCGNTFPSEIQVIVVAVFAILSPFLLIIYSYIRIISTILQMASAESQQKAFSTCSSHLLVVTLFYGTAGSMYLRPKYSYCASVDKFLSLSYSVVTPLLNPVIYSLRNKEVKGALRKKWRKISSVWK